MKKLIRNNTHLFPAAMNEAHRISGRSFRTFDWSGYVKNEFPSWRHPTNQNLTRENIKNILFCAKWIYG